MVSQLFGIFNGMRSDDDCDEVRGMSSDYLDGELGQCGAATVSRHILKCGPCASLSTPCTQLWVFCGRHRKRSHRLILSNESGNRSIESGAIDLALFPRTSAVITPAPMNEIPVTINKPRAPHGEVLELVDHALNTHHFSLC